MNSMQRRVNFQIMERIKNLEAQMAELRATTKHLAELIKELRDVDGTVERASDS